MCLCVGVRSVSAGTRWPFHAPPQLKPRYEVKSGKKRQEGSRTGHKARCVNARQEQNEGVYTVLLYVGGEEWKEDARRGSDIVGKKELEKGQARFPCAQLTLFT